jgi:AcrR family transcriptional regulator
VLLTNRLVNKRARSGRDTRAAIFRAAAIEFSARGYDGAATERIAARARVNKAMLYYHFGNKRGLYLAIVREMIETLGTRLRAIADGPAAAADKIDTWVAVIVEEGSARPWFPPIMLRELASGARHFDATVFTSMNGVVDTVRRIIEQGRREGTFRPVDPLLAHLTIMPPVLLFLVRQGVVASARVPKGVLAPLPVDQFVHHMQAAVRGMLRKEP